MGKCQKANQKIQTKTLLGIPGSMTQCRLPAEESFLLGTGPQRREGRQEPGSPMTQTATGQPGRQLPAHPAARPCLSWPHLLAPWRAQGWGPGFPTAAPGLSTEVGDPCGTGGRFFSPSRQSLTTTETSPFVLLSLAISLVHCCLQPQLSATMRKTQEVKTPCPGWWS